MKKVQWIKEGLNFLPYYCMVFNQREYDSVLDGLKALRRIPFEEDCCMSIHWYWWDGRRVAVVTVQDKVLQKTVPVILGFIAHEATHIVQEGMRFIGEDKPSDEFQAYLVGKTTEELTRVFFNREFPQLLRHKTR